MKHTETDEMREEQQRGNTRPVRMKRDDVGNRAGYGENSLYERSERKGSRHKKSRSVTGQMSETFLLGAFLAVVGGYLDAYTYICRDHVFANAQTGNLVLLGIKAAEGDLSGALYYLIPITSFLIGILVAEIIKNRYRYHRQIHWRQIIIGFETVILVLVAFLPQGRGNMAANVLVSFVCSLQVQSFRKMNGNAYATTMCTGNLRSAMEGMYLYYRSKNKAVLGNSLRYFGIVLFFILGAALGALLTRSFMTRSVLFACLGLMIVFFLMFWKGEE